MNQGAGKLSKAKGLLYTTSDFTMGKTLEVVQDPKGGIQGISLGSISRFEDSNYVVDDDVVGGFSAPLCTATSWQLLTPPARWRQVSTYTCTEA